MKKIIVILGTRPEAIKLCPVIKQLQDRQNTSVHVCVTAQHREMLDQMLSVFDVRPDTDLDLMQPDQRLADLTGRALQALDDFICRETPDMVLVQGDTTTAMVAALAAFYNKIPVGHVEAGLRTWRKYAPFPEEVNRVMISRLADLHFAPTPWARDNLLCEGIADHLIHVTGNTVIDALFIALKKVRDCSPDALELPPSIRQGGFANMVLITGHRRENMGEGFEHICDAIRRLAGAFSDVRFVYPVHLNPRIRSVVHSRLAGLSNVILTEPLSYLAFVFLMDKARLILTDSGGVQEEAPSLGTPVLVMRDFSERPEGITSGLVRLVGTDVEMIVREAKAILLSPVPALRELKQNPYGDGHAAERIARLCDVYLKGI